MYVANGDWLEKEEAQKLRLDRLLWEAHWEAAHMFTCVCCASLSCDLHTHSHNLLLLGVSCRKKLFLLWKRSNFWWVDIEVSNEKIVRKKWAISWHSIQDKVKGIRLTKTLLHVALFSQILNNTCYAKITHLKIFTKENSDSLNYEYCTFLCV